MKQIEKNLLIIALLGISFIFIWTFSNYRKANKVQVKIENNKTNQKTPEEVAQEEIDLLPSISSIELKNLIFTKNPPIILDIRNEEVFKKGHIINSIQTTSIGDDRNSKDVILVTEYGTESNIPPIYNSLTEKYNTVKILMGGFNAWKNANGIIISYGDSNSFIDQSKIKFIEPRDVNKNYTEYPEKILIIDVRRKGNFTDSHVPGAINIPILELEKKHRDISSQKKVYVYGETTESSFSAGVILYDLGFFNIETINGGFEAWKKYNYPLEPNSNTQEIDEKQITE